MSPPWTECAWPRPKTGLPIDDTHLPPSPPRFALRKKKSQNRFPAHGNCSSIFAFRADAREFAPLPVWPRDRSTSRLKLRIRNMERIRNTKREVKCNIRFISSSDFRQLREISLHELVEHCARAWRTARLGTMTSSRLSLAPSSQTLHRSPLKTLACQSKDRGSIPTVLQ